MFSLISGLDDGSIVVWNPLETDEAKKKRILPRKHWDSVWSLSFSPDGRFLASAALEREIIIWWTEVRNWRGKMCNYWTCAVCYCQFTSRNGLSSRRAPVSLFTKLFFRFPSLFRLGRLFSPAQLIVVGTRVSRGCHSTR